MTSVHDSPWWQIGWRNLGRHPKRTAITAVGLGVGYFAVVFLVGWSIGLMAQMVENGTGLVSGQIEIHDAEYRPDRSLYDTIGGREGADVGDILRTVVSDPAVVAAAPRLYAGGLISSGASTSAGMLMGIDPSLEPDLTRFLDDLVEGRLSSQGATSCWSVTSWLGSSRRGWETRSCWSRPGPTVRWATTCSRS